MATKHSTPTATATLARGRQGTRTAAPTPEPHPNGLSFCTVVRGRGDDWLSWNLFDVPAETYADGYPRGIQAAGELLQAIKHGAPFVQVPDLLQAASDAMGKDEPCRPGTLDRRGAAVGFLRTVEDALAFAARHSDHAAHIAAKLARMQAVEATSKADKQARTTAAVQRMRAGREAKRALAAAATSSGRRA